MAKKTTVYYCSKCDTQFPKWQGRCTECGAWGTIEVSAQSVKISAKEISSQAAKIVTLDQIKTGSESRLISGISEFDRVVGGGLVLGSVTLLAGEPGIGKSTLVIQLCQALLKQLQTNKNLLYISGEESLEQIKLRVERLQLAVEQLNFLRQTSVEIIAATIKKNKPQLVIIDSIQSVQTEELPSEAGSLNQVRAATVKLLTVAKEKRIPIILIGHVTKEGIVSGPKQLEHIVDTVLYLEGESAHDYRLLKTSKNRFGPVDEVGVFTMTNQGLKPISNPSEFFLQETSVDNPGSAITALMEGSRAILVEVQALVSPTSFGYPKRTASGFDLNRLNLLVAILSQRCGLKLQDKDVYVNIVGGLKTKEPAADLAVCLAIASALKDKPLPEKSVAFGEVGLGGEIRGVSKIEDRIKEAAKLGYQEIITNISNKGVKKVRLTKSSDLLTLIKTLFK